MAPRISSRLITIGEFARLGGVSVKALRLYARRGLLAPAAVDPRSRYRFYSHGQLATLQRILLLKSAGLPLALIGEQLSRPNQTTLSRIRQTLLVRAQEVQRQLSWVDAEIEAAQNGAALPQVAIKRVPRTLVASRRRRMDSYVEADALLTDLRRQIPGQARLVSGAIWHDCGGRSHVIDGEVFWIVGRSVRGPSIAELPSATVASILHHGDESTIGASYEALRRWMRDSRLDVVGPNREIYVGGSENGSNTVTEIQFPIASVL